MQIGDTLYTYDVNRPGARNNPDAAWFEHTIIAETRQSWILSGYQEYKVDKLTMRLRLKELYGMSAKVYTPAEKEDKAWHDEHVFVLRRIVEHADTPTLRKIAALLGVE